MLQVILVAILVLMALSYVFASVAGDGTTEESVALTNEPEQEENEYQAQNAA